MFVQQCIVDRRETVAVDGVHVGALLDEKLRHRQIAMGACEM